MRKAVDIYGDKEHITEVNASYVFFTFPDGSQDRLKSRKADLIEVYKWVGEEMSFWHRMYEETYQLYKSEKERFDRGRHYFTEEEIHEANKKNHFAYIDMEISNKYYLRDSNYISGKGEMAFYANDKYWKYVKLAHQINNAINKL